MKILLLSFYYKPDLCAGSFRSSALVEKLKAFPDLELDLITTLPNRYASFSADAQEYEEIGNVRIHRVSLPAHQSGIVDQAKAFLRFYTEALRITKNQSYDGIYATSSRLFTAFLGARISRRIGVPLYLDIRDIFVDTISDVMSSKITWIAKPIFSMLERYSFGQAGRINLVSGGFKEYFELRYPKMPFRWFTNGIDQEFIDAAPENESVKSSGSMLTILYAGNIGEGQGLHTIIPELAKRLEKRARFVIIGDGGRKQVLEEKVQELNNVELKPPVKRAELIAAYQEADVLFLHLNDYDAFKKVLPSKIFEYATLGKPILAGVSGFSSSFIKDEVKNCAVFNPGNSEEAEVAFRQLELSTKPRTSFVQKFSRDTITNEMAEDIVVFFKKFDFI